MEFPDNIGHESDSFGECQREEAGSRSFYLSQRLDSLMPIDPELGVVTPVALRVYLGSAMELVIRSAHPLALLAISMDVAKSGTTLGDLFGANASSLIAAGVGRSLRQETRLYDVVGLADAVEPGKAPTYLIVCPLLDEVHGAQLGARLRAAIMAFATDPEQIGIRASVGVAALSLSTIEPEALITRAVEALYCARRVEGGCVWRHSETLQRLSSDQPSDDDESPSTFSEA